MEIKEYIQEIEGNLKLFNNNYGFFDIFKKIKFHFDAQNYYEAILIGSVLGESIINHYTIVRINKKLIDRLYIKEGKTYVKSATNKKIILQLEIFFETDKCNFNNEEKSRLKEVLQDKQASIKDKVEKLLDKEKGKVVDDFFTTIRNKLLHGDDGDLTKGLDHSKSGAFMVHNGKFMNFGENKETDKVANEYLAKKTGGFEMILKDICDKQLFQMLYNVSSITND